MPDSGLSKWVESKWDKAEARVLAHRRKLTVFGFVVVFWPQWFPAAKIYFADAMEPLLSMDFSNLSSPDWSVWNWLTVPLGFVIMWRALRQRPPVSTGISGGVTWRHIPADSSEGKSIKINLLTAELEEKNREIENLKLSFQQMTEARDAAIDAYKRGQHNFAMWRFTQFTQDYPGVTVKIRTAGYNDWPLVQQIKKLFEVDARWKVEIDPNNSPPLMPNAHFKVVLETGDIGTLHRVHSLLDAEDGGLLPVKVGIQHNPENHNTNHLIVEVLPIVNK